MHGIKVRYILAPSETQKNKIMTTYRIHIHTDNGFYKEITFRAATITDAIQVACGESAIRIDVHNADKSLSQLYRRSDSCQIWQDIVAAPEC